MTEKKQKSLYGAPLSTGSLFSKAMALVCHPLVRATAICLGFALASKLLGHPVNTALLTDVGIGLVALLLAEGGDRVLINKYFGPEDRKNKAITMNPDKDSDRMQHFDLRDAQGVYKAIKYPVLIYGGMLAAFLASDLLRKDPAAQMCLSAALLLPTALRSFENRWLWSRIVTFKTMITPRTPAKLPKLSLASKEAPSNS